MKMLVTILKKRLGQKSLISKKATVPQLGISSFFVTENFLSQTPFLIGLFFFRRILIIRIWIENSENL